MTDAPPPRASASASEPSGGEAVRVEPGGGKAAHAERVGGKAARGEFEFSEADKEGLASLAASMSFVGVCQMLLGLMSGTFGAAAGYGGFVPVGVGLAVGAAVCLPLGWWTTSAGRSLSALVRTRGRDVTHLMEAVVQLRRLFGFARVFIILYALAAAAAGGAFVWCNFVVEKGGRCFAGWG